MNSVVSWYCLLGVRVRDRDHLGYGSIWLLEHVLQPFEIWLGVALVEGELLPILSKSWWTTADRVINNWKRSGERHAVFQVQCGFNASRKFIVGSVIDQFDSEGARISTNVFRVTIFSDERGNIRVINPLIKEACHPKTAATCCRVDVECK